MVRIFFILFYVMTLLGFSQRNDSLAKTYERTFKEQTPKKYTNKDFNYIEKLEKSNELSFFERVKQWLAEFFSNLFGLNDGFSFVGNFLNFLSIIIVLIVVYIIVRALIKKEGFWLFKGGDKRIIETTTFEENINEINFEKAIVNAKKRGEHRQVIRLYYLWLLKTYSNKGYIDWHINKTNADYLYEIEDQNIKNEFAYLSYLFNYTWYGNLDISSVDFEKMNESFEKTLKSISS